MKPAETDLLPSGVDAAAQEEAWLADLGAAAFAPKSDRAIWLQIHDRLKDAIASGALAAGAQLPGENQLALAFGVTRVTLRRALRKLQQEGWLAARKGVGVFVRQRPAVYTVADDNRFAEALDAAAGPVSTETLALSRAPMSAEAALALGRETAAEAVWLRRIRLIDGLPIYLTVKNFPAERFPRFEETYWPRQSVALVFAAHGIERYARAETRVSGGFASVEEAEALRLTPGTPVLRTSAVNVDAEGRAIEHGLGCWPLNSIELVFRRG